MAKDSTTRLKPVTSWFADVQATSACGTQAYRRRWQTVLRSAESIRTGVSEAPRVYAEMSAEQRDAYYLGLHTEALAAGRALAARQEFARYRRVVDVGGGSGGVAQVGKHERGKFTPLHENIARGREGAERLTAMRVDQLHDDIMMRTPQAPARAYLLRRSSITT